MKKIEITTPGRKRHGRKELEMRVMAKQKTMHDIDMQGCEDLKQNQCLHVQQIDEMFVKIDALVTTVLPPITCTESRTMMKEVQLDKENANQYNTLRVCRRNWNPMKLKRIEIIVSWKVNTNQLQWITGENRRLMKRKNENTADRWKTNSWGQDRRAQKHSKRGLDRKRNRSKENAMEMKGKEIQRRERNGTLTGRTGASRMEEMSKELHRREEKTFELHRTEEDTTELDRRAKNTLELYITQGNANKRGKGLKDLLGLDTGDHNKRESKRLKENTNEWTWEIDKGLKRREDSTREISRREDTTRNRTGRKKNPEVDREEDKSMELIKYVQTLYLNEKQEISRETNSRDLKTRGKTRRWKQSLYPHCMSFEQPAPSLCQLLVSKNFEEEVFVSKYCTTVAKPDTLVFERLMIHEIKDSLLPYVPVPDRRKEKFELLEMYQHDSSCIFDVSYLKPCLVQVRTSDVIQNCLVPAPPLHHLLVNTLFEVCVLEYCDIIAMSDKQPVCESFHSYENKDILLHYATVTDRWNDKFDALEICLQAFTSATDLQNRKGTGDMLFENSQLVISTNVLKLTDIGQDIYINCIMANLRASFLLGPQMLTHACINPCFSMTDHDSNLRKFLLIKLKPSTQWFGQNVTHEINQRCQIPKHLFPSLKDGQLKLEVIHKERYCKQDVLTVLTKNGLKKSTRYDIEFNLGEQIVKLNDHAQTRPLFDVKDRGLFSSYTDMTNAENVKRGMKNSSKFTKELDEMLFNSFTCPQRLTVAPLESLRQHFDKLAQGDEQTQEDRMRYEGFRLGTFNKVNIAVSCIALAAAGFYATGDGDETRCFSCRNTHRGWGRLDKPSEIHRIISPGCHFISGHDSSNIPIHSKEPTTPLSSFGNDGSSMERQSDPNSGSSLTSNLDNGYISSTNVEAHGQSQAHGGCSTMDVQVTNAKHPHYQDARRRVESFTSWPLTNCKKPADLVPVGFFYAGYSDCVRCFCCGVGLRRWKEEDDPWREHINGNAACEYVRRVKGESFIADTLGSTGRTPRNPTLLELGSSSNGSDILSRPVCKQLLEMGFGRDEVVRHFKSVEKTRDPNTIQIETLLEKLISDAPQEGNALPGNQTSSAESSTPYSTPSGLIGWNTDGGSRETEALNQEERYRSLDEGYGSAPYSSSPEGAGRGVCHSMPLTGTGRSDSGSGTRRGLNIPSRAMLTTLTEENRELRESGLCKICLDEDANMVFLPCGHLLACVTCTPALERCPLCRSFIRGTVRVHLADMSSMNRRR